MAQGRKDLRQADVGNDVKIMLNYKLEFILHTHNSSRESINGSLSEFGEGVEITEHNDPDSKGNNFKINLITQDPTVIFDMCGQIGRIRQVKVWEEPRT